MKRRGQARRKKKEVQRDPQEQAALELVQMLEEPRNVVDDEIIAKALYVARGNKKLAAGMLGIHPNTLHSRIKKSEALKFAVMQGQAALLHKAMVSAEALVEKQNPSMTQFMLKSLGGEQFDNKQRVEISAAKVEELPTRTEEEQTQHDNDVNDILMGLT